MGIVCVCTLIFILILQAEIEKLVTSMCGIFQTKTSPDVSFVIVKNVLAAKYKVGLIQSHVSFFFFFSIEPLALNYGIYKA